MKYGELVSAVYNLSGYSTDDGLVTPAVVGGAVNEALAEIAAERDWPWLRASATITTVVGTTSYAVPTDWTRTDRIVDATTGEPLERWDAEQLEQMWADDSGLVQAFAVDLEQVVLRPVPDRVRAYTHFYVRVEKTLASDNETPYLPAQFSYAAVALAESRAHEAGRNLDRMQAARDRYNKVWRVRMMDDATRARGPLRISIRPGAAL